MQWLEQENAVVRKGTAAVAVKLSLLCQNTQQKQLQKQEFILAHGLRVESIMTTKARWLKNEEAGHTAHSQEVEEGKCAL